MLLDNMERPAALSPAAQRMCLLSFSLRMFPWTQPSLARQILATGKLIGQFPDAGPGVCGRGFLEPSVYREADLQTAVQAVSHNGEIVFEAFADQRHYSRRRPGTQGMFGCMVSSVTADYFTRSCSGHYWCAHPDSLLIRAAIVSDGFVDTP